MTGRQDKEIDTEKSLGRESSRASRPQDFARPLFFSRALFSRVTLDGLSESGTTRSLSRVQSTFLPKKSSGEERGHLSRTAAGKSNLPCCSFTLLFVQVEMLWIDDNPVP